MKFFKLNLTFFSCFDQHAYFYMENLKVTFIIYGSSGTSQYKFVM